MSETECHHGDIYLAWRRVKLAVWTNTIDGLTESGFIWAAKADDTLNGWESICDIWF